MVEAPKILEPPVLALPPNPVLVLAPKPDTMVIVVSAGSAVMRVCAWAEAAWLAYRIVSNSPRERKRKEECS